MKVGTAFGAWKAAQVTKNVSLSFLDAAKETARYRITLNKTFNRKVGKNK